jgi:two-component system response regulator
MNKVVKSINILMAEDDPEDQMLVKEAFEEARLGNDFQVVSNGEELLDCLKRIGRYADSARPDLILLDLNMPRKDGRQALAEIKSDPDLKRIPVVVLTTSNADEDIVRSYDLGVSSYIQKPVTFEKLVDVVRTFGKYWVEIVELPPCDRYGE